MQVEYHKWYSRYLNRDMEYKTFGDRGHALIAFPCQDGRFFDYADQGMIHVLTPWIEAGKIRVICVDGIDWETWSNFGGDPRWRIEQHERWFNYIIEELLPNIRYYDGETFMTTGCSMGAMHAANFFFRRPDIFDTVIRLPLLFGRTHLRQFATGLPPEHARRSLLDAIVSPTPHHLLHRTRTMGRGHPGLYA